MRMEYDNYEPILICFKSGEEEVVRLDKKNINNLRNKKYKGWINGIEMDIQKPSIKKYIFLRKRG